jgi:uncharacterized protein YkwD
MTALAIAFALAAPLFAVDDSNPAMASAVIEQMNRERATHGLKPLRVNGELCAAALDRIDDMFAKHYFSHVSPDGIQPWEWVDKRGYDYRAMGENLAVGYSTAESVVDGWMHSPKHRENVLMPAFDEVGVAVVPASPQRPFHGPTVVALYGER